jgi:hypothetical protein
MIGWLCLVFHELDTVYSFWLVIMDPIILDIPFFLFYRPRSSISYYGTYVGVLTRIDGHERLGFGHISSPATCEHGKQLGHDISLFLETHYKRRYSYMYEHLTL